MDNEKLLKLRVRNQIIQNELADIMEISIRIVKPNAPKVYFDYHTQKGQRICGNVYEKFLEKLKNTPFEDKSEDKSIKDIGYDKYLWKNLSKEYSNGKVVPREDFWHTYYSREPLYINKIRSHPINEEKIKSFYQLFVVKKIVDLLEKQDEESIAFTDCWGLLSMIAYLPLREGTDMNNKEERHFLLCGLRPKIFPDGKRETAIGRLINALPYRSGLDDERLRELIIKVKEIEPHKEDHGYSENSDKEITEQDYFNHLIVRSEIIKKVFKTIEYEFKNRYSLPKEEWVSLTRVFAFYEFQRQKTYLEKVFDSLKAININKLAIQTIQGYKTSSGEDRLVLSTLHPLHNGGKILPIYEYLNTDYILTELKKGGWFDHSYSDEKQRYALRFIDKFSENKGVMVIKPIKKIKINLSGYGEESEIDLSGHGEEIGIALQSAYRRYIRQSEHNRYEWNSEKIFDLAIELDRDIKNIIAQNHDKSDKNPFEVMYKRIINLALRIVCGQRCMFIRIDYPKGRLIPEADVNVHSNSAFTDEEKEKIKAFDIRASSIVECQECKSLLKWPHQACIKHKRTDSENCRIFNIFEKAQSCLCVPVLFIDRAFGVIYIDGILENQFNDADKQYMTNFANSIAPHLQHQNTLFQLNNLHRIASEEKKDISEKIYDITKLICRAMLSDYASIWRYDHAENKIKLYSSYGYTLEDSSRKDKKAFYKTGEGTIGKAVKEKRPISEKDIGQSDTKIDYKEQLLKQGIKSTMSTPMFLPPDDKLLGAMQILNRDAIPYSKAMENYFQTLADQAMFVISMLFEGPKVLTQIGHEIQTMLVNISGQANRVENLLGGIYSDNNPDENGREREKIQRNNIKRALKDIQEISDYAIKKVTAITQLSSVGDPSEILLKTDQEELILKKLIMDIIRRHRGEIDKKNLICYQPNIQSHFKIWMNAENFDMIFGNIFQNAIKYSFPKTEITVDIEITKGSFIISVINQGVIIPEECRELIFNPEFRLVDSEQYKRYWPNKFPVPFGKGWGMTVSRRAALKYQGEVYLEYSRDAGYDTQYGRAWENCIKIVFPMTSSRKPLFGKKKEEVIKNV